MSWTQETSLKLFDDAKKYIPGGVNSPVRAFKSVDGSPLFIKRAQGAYLWDEDNQKYIDYVGSWGPAILGHAHPIVVQKIQEVVSDGISFGAPTKLETVLVKKIQEFFPSMEMMRLVSSGTEACMSVLRVARGYTKRNKIIKFEGCYHGHADMLLVKAGSGLATFGVPTSPGVPEGTTKDTLVCAYNDCDELAALFQNNKNEIAAIILEPIVGNSGFIRPTKNFLDAMQDLCKKSGALLIFDEVMTGFRVSMGGAQKLFDVKPDLSVLGKVIGGGMPLAAYGGRKEIMEIVSPSGPVYQAGTLSGNPVGVTCGITTLEIMQKEQIFNKISKVTGQLTKGLAEIAAKFKLPFTADFEGGMFGFFFCEGTVKNFEDAKKHDATRFKKFFWGMLKEGVYLAPSAYEAGFVSFAHEENDISKTLMIAEKIMSQI